MDPLPSDILDKTYDLLNDVGWCQDEFLILKTGEPAIPGPDYPSKESLAGACLFGAVAYTMNVRPFWTNIEHVTDFLGKAMVPESFGTAIIHWNNHPCRTKQEVLCLVQRAAELARASGS